jgi:hypothetical protein
MYIAAVFESERFGKFECNNSLEEFDGNKFNGRSFVIEVFLVFSSGNMKDLSVSITLYKIIALTNSAI